MKQGKARDGPDGDQELDKQSSLARKYQRDARNHCL
jgi:hypothetical protein